MGQRKNKKLIYQFLFFILPFIISSIAITGLILSLANYNFFQKTIQQDYANIIKSSSGEIRMFMDNARRNLENIALVISSTKLDSWQKEIALTAFLLNNPQFVSIDLFSGTGEKIISTIPGGHTHINNAPKIFARALSGKTAISDVMLVENDIPHVNIAVPVFRLGKVTRVLWAELDLKAIWDVLEGITIGQSGQVYILDLSGRTIAHREIDRVVRAIPAAKPDILKELRDTSAPVEWTEDKDGGTTYNLGAYIPELEWIIVLSQPIIEIYVHLYRNLFWAMMITLSVCIMAVWLGWRWIRRFLIPIQTMHRQVREIGQGNLDQKVSVQSENEIGDLGIAFNEMTDSLKAYIDREVENARALAHAKNLALLGTAASKMTHEMGNYLNNSQMALAGLKRETLSPGGENILKIIDNESDRVKAFIRQFLQFAKKPVLNLQKTRLDLVIREIIDIVGPEAERRGIDIVLDWDAAIPQVSADAGLMSQVINNLIKNSMDAISGAGSIAISGRMENKDLVISVSDTGEGIAPENAENIFEPFFTTKGAAGTGLGMPIVKSNVEAHGGTISCKSDPGKGTVFVIRLPI